MKRFGIMYGVKGRRKKAETFASDYERNMNAKAVAAIGLRVRKFTRKPADKKGKWI